MLRLLDQKIEKTESSKNMETYWWWLIFMQEVKIINALISEELLITESSILIN